jgi:hypothetical protein
MTPATFLPQIEAALRSRFAPFDAAELLCFVEDAWPLIQDEPDAGAWATAFLEARWMARVPGA